MILVKKNINLRLVSLDDAEFIVKLRSDERKNKYLNKADTNTEKQKEWLKLYKEREKLRQEFYFVIKAKDETKLGLVRLYDFKGDSFCWGSFIIVDEAPFYVAIETVLAVYDFAFYELNFKQSHFDVRKQNKQVVDFHKRFGALIVGEDEQNYYFNISLKEYEKNKKRYERFI